MAEARGELVTGQRPGAAPVHLSVVVPVYRCAGCLVDLHRRLVGTLEPLVPSFEILLVNDGGPAGDWETIDELARGDRRVRGIDLSRNFGQHFALTAGLDRASGEWTVVMDCDLQHPPEEIPRLYGLARAGHDVVIGRRVHRRDPVARRAASWLFSRLHAVLTGTRYDSRLSNFSILSRPVREALGRLRERHRTYTSLLLWVGFDVAFVDYEHDARLSGRSAYGLASLGAFALDSLAFHADRPLRLSAGLGVALALGSVVTGMGLGYGILTGVAVSGWAVALTVSCLLAGLLFVDLGLVGLYVGRLLEESRGRPLYIVKRTVNVEPTATTRGETP